MRVCNLEDVSTRLSGSDDLAESPGALPTRRQLLTIGAAATLLAALNREAAAGGGSVRLYWLQHDEA